MIVGGRTRGFRWSDGCGMRGLLGQCWSSWRIPEQDAGRPPGRAKASGAGRGRKGRGPGITRGNGPTLGCTFLRLFLCRFLSFPFCGGQGGRRLGYPN